MKRNLAISHKELPEQWHDHKYIDVPYKSLVIGVVKALRLMKKIDKHHLGPSAPYLWKEMRRKRYTITSPASAGYLLLPHFWPSPADRAKILAEEDACGMPVWQTATLKIGGVEREAKLCGKWGAIKLDTQIILLSHSFVELESIDDLSPLDN